jgi:hypothetical protein
MSAHVMGPLIGSDALGWHADCQGCGTRVEADSRDALRLAHQRHAGRDAHRAGLANARRMLADTVERKAAAS